MEDGEPAHARVEDADRPRIHRGDCRSGLRWCPMQRAARGVCLVFTLAAAPAAHAAAYTTTDEVATMDDGVGIAVTLYQPVGLGPPECPA